MYILAMLLERRDEFIPLGTLLVDAGFFPWGDEQQVYVNNCSQDYKFTGKEQDPDMGIIYFGARFYQDPIASVLSGRLVSEPRTRPVFEARSSAKLESLYVCAE